MSGAIDASQITNTDVAELKGNPAVAVMTPHDATKHTLLFQTQDPVLKNVKLRQAIAAALDIPQVVAAASEGLGELNNPPFTPARPTTRRPRSAPTAMIRRGHSNC